MDCSARRFTGVPNLGVRRIARATPTGDHGGSVVAGDRGAPARAACWRRVHAPPRGCLSAGRIEHHRVERTCVGGDCHEVAETSWSRRSVGQAPAARNPRRGRCMYRVCRGSRRESTNCAPTVWHGRDNSADRVPASAAAGRVTAEAVLLQRKLRRYVVIADDKLKSAGTLFGPTNAYEYAPIRAGDHQRPAYRMTVLIQPPRTPGSQILKAVPIDIPSRSDRVSHASGTLVGNPTGYVGFEGQQLVSFPRVAIHDRLPTARAPQARQPWTIGIGALQFPLAHLPPFLDVKLHNSVLALRRDPRQLPRDGCYESKSCRSRSRRHRMRRAVVRRRDRRRERCRGSAARASCTHAASEREGRAYAAGTPRTPPSACRWTRTQGPSSGAPFRPTGPEGSLPSPGSGCRGDPSRGSRTPRAPAASRPSLRRSRRAPHSVRLPCAAGPPRPHRAELAGARRRSERKPRCRRVAGAPEDRRAPVGHQRDCGLGGP